MNKLIFKIAIAIVLLSNILYAELIFGEVTSPDFWLGMVGGFVLAITLLSTLGQLLARKAAARIDKLHRDKMEELQ